MRVVAMRYEQRIEQAPDSCWMFVAVLLAPIMNVIMFAALVIKISCIALIVSVLGRHGHNSPVRCPRPARTRRCSDVSPGSVALLADAIHNLADALTAVPLWIAFALSRRPLMITTRACKMAVIVNPSRLILTARMPATLAPHSRFATGCGSKKRRIDSYPASNADTVIMITMNRPARWVLIAGVIGFAGNELVAMYRIRVGRRIGSAALVADGVHARTDGFTSFAVVLGVIGVWLGFPLADPIVGLVISIVIFVLLWGTARDVGRRLLDGVDPSLVAQAEEAVASVPGITGVEDVRLRWTGHRLNVDATVTSDPAMPVGRFHELEHEADQIIRSQLSGIDVVRLNPSAHPPASVVGVGNHMGG